MTWGWNQLLPVNRPTPGKSELWRQAVELVLHRHNEYPSLELPWCRRAMEEAIPRSNPPRNKS